MGKKRKREPNPECNPEQKKHKSNIVAQAPAECLQRTPSTEQEVDCGLTDLEQLVRRLATARNAVQARFESGGKQVANAISHLTEALDQSTRVSPEETSSSASYSIVPSRFNPSKGSAEPPEGALPALPPITDAGLEKAVFTHQGVAVARPTTGEKSYDRLELLGDAYIELIATRLIWHHYQSLPAGRLSQLRELLVKNETLAEFATNYRFDKRVSVPPDHRDQAKRWIKIKGDVFEAYAAAVILSNPRSGFEWVEAWLTALWLPKLAKAQPNAPCSFPKQELAKKIMGRGIKIDYVEERPSICLNGGLRTFFVGVYLTGWGWSNAHLGSGTGQSKTEAGNNAATKALINTTLIDEIASIKKSFDENNMRSNIQ